jgi:hypothetical protein
MKKKVTQLLLAAFLLCGISLHAQTDFHFGVKADIDLTKVSGNGMSNSLTTDYEGGLYGEINFGKKWGIQPEVMYSRRDAKIADDFSAYYINQVSIDYKKTVKLNYIVVPVMARYNISTLFSVLLGPQFGFKLYDDEDLLKSGKPAFKDLDFGIAGGVQLNISESFKFYARYYQGLSNINNIDDRYDWKTRQIQIGTAVRIL